jgi:hypothetical protein
MRRRCIAGPAASAVVAALAAAWPASPGLAQTLPTAAPALSPRDAREIARAAYVYAYPLVLSEITRRVMTNAERPEGHRSPMGQLAHVRALPDAAFTDLPRPGADTLASTAYFDVSKEPMIVTVPDSGGRWYQLSLIDMWTEVFASRSRRTSTGAQTFAVVGPRWQGRLPNGVGAIRSPTSIVLLAGRTQVNDRADKADLAAAVKFQAGIKAVPLSQYGRSYKPPKGNVDPERNMTAPAAQVARMDAEAFFALLAWLMHDNPPHPGDSAMLARLKRIGIGPGKPFALAAAAPEVRQALQAAPAEALQAIETAFARSGALANGWRSHLAAMGTYGNDYLQRAAAAYAGLGGVVPDDMVSATAFADADGQPLTGEGSYMLHFGKDQLPPARASWSLTLYDDRQRLAANPPKRHAIAGGDKLWLNDDGSLDIFVQPDSPGRDKEANWLPTPAGPFTLTLRLHWPKPEALKGTWVPPPLRLQDGESVGTRALR